MNMVDAQDFSDNSPKFGTELDLADGEEYVQDKGYKNADISDYLK